MSWDAYVTNLLAADKNGTASVWLAAICGMNPPSVWASTPNFPVTVSTRPGSRVSQNRTTVQEHACVGSVGLHFLLQLLPVS